MREGGHYLSLEFVGALGQMCASFEARFSMIAARCDLKVRGDLRDIVPPESMPDNLD